MLKGKVHKYGADVNTDVIIHFDLRLNTPMRTESSWRWK